MSIPELLDLVRQMRSAQREYFRGRTPTALHAAKALEARVDAGLEMIAGGSPQADLFGNRLRFGQTNEGPRG